eukprot:scaffold5798_cov105-Isochrysis_galbana.AAC.1
MNASSPDPNGLSAAHAVSLGSSETSSCNTWHDTTNCARSLSSSSFSSTLGDHGAAPARPGAARQYLCVRCNNNVADGLFCCTVAFGGSVCLPDTTAASGACARSNVEHELSFLLSAFVRVVHSNSSFRTRTPAALRS